MTSAPGETLERRAAVRPGAIILARHGKPASDRSVRIGWRDYEKWWANYDLSGLEAGQDAPAYLLATGMEAQVIFASTLRRAVETAEAVANGKPVMQDEVFVEAALPPPPLVGRYSPRTWGVFARIAWWLGRSAGRESRQEAEQRAEAAVATLTARALRGETVLLLAHGWFNRMMRPILKRQGWVETENRGDSYWSHRRFERKH